jgi:hypothetical protein
MQRSVTTVMALLAIAMLACACEGKKDPLVPDNPNADPLMMDGGAAPAPSAQGK